jgi:dinuclear metal center YbgI/SA1388 family protein
VASRDEIVGFCDQLLETAAFTDYGPNGMQVPGAAEVDRVATCVSAHRESIEAAIGEGAQMLLAHHGLFWDFLPRSLTEQMAERLRAALGAGLTVAGYHLPLDAHREIGNNALLCAELGLRLTDIPIGEVKGRGVGAVGLAEDGLPARELFERVERATGRAPLVFDAGPAEVERVGIVSGAASSALAEAVGLDLDAFITGEPAEHVMADAREGGIHFIAAGHYATETFGIRRLGELVAERLGVEHSFIDVPNPV